MWYIKITKVLPLFIAFCSPYDNPTNMFEYHTKDYISAFVKDKVSVIIRLNEPLYNAKSFENHNIKHYDLYFDDCTAPNKDIVEKFINISIKHNKEIIAIHCRSGIGRTVTLICIWMIINYDITVEEAIGYLRIMRQGSVLDLQKKFLQKFYNDYIINKLAIS